MGNDRILSVPGRGRYHVLGSGMRGLSWQRLGMSCTPPQTGQGGYVAKQMDASEVFGAVSKFARHDGSYYALFDGVCTLRHLRQ